MLSFSYGIYRHMVLVVLLLQYPQLRFSRLNILILKAGYVHSSSSTALASYAVLLQGVQAALPSTLIIA